jgi:hypothetical protein
MKKNILLILGIVLTTLNCNSQTKINEELKKELDQILFIDQIYREYIDNSTTAERRTEIANLTNQDPEYLHQNIFKIIPKTDSINFAKVVKIIEKHGYPGKTLVGEPANTAAFYVIQHNPNQIPHYYPIIEKAGKKGEIPFRLSAMMLDRKLANEGKEQIYGTQIYGKSILNKKTGKQSFFSYVVPIKDPKNVNKRRKEAGFESTIEEYVKEFSLEYEEYTYDQLNTILK